MSTKKAPYRVRYHEDKPPPKRIFTGSRWDIVIDRLPDLKEEEGTIEIAVPKALINKEQTSLRGAIDRWRRREGITVRYSVRMLEEGLVVFRPSRKRWEDEKGNLPAQYDDSNQETDDDRSY